MRNPILVALDVPTAEKGLELARLLAPVVGGFKVGKELFTAAGPEMVRQLRAMGAGVFLDLKFHDIPNTVAKAVESAVALDVQMLTIHTSGGLAMMAAAEKAAQETALRRGVEPPLVLGVTVLTSMDGPALADLGLPPDPAAQVLRLARLAVRAGLRGLVCSPLELTALRREIPGNVQLVTPGIGPAGSGQDDQKRTSGPAEAMAAGATWLVIGRPICAAPDPRAAAEAILGTLRG